MRSMPKPTRAVRKAVATTSTPGVAITGRARCRACKRLIQKGERVRVLTLHVAPGFTRRAYRCAGECRRKANE